MMMMMMMMMMMTSHSPLRHLQQRFHADYRQHFMRTDFVLRDLSVFCAILSILMFILTYTCINNLYMNFYNTADKLNTLLLFIEYPRRSINQWKHTEHTGITVQQYANKYDNNAGAYLFQTLSPSAILSCPWAYASYHWCLTLRRCSGPHSSALTATTNRATATTSSFMTSRLPAQQPPMTSVFTVHCC